MKKDYSKLHERYTEVNNDHSRCNFSNWNFDKILTVLFRLVVQNAHGQHGANEVVDEW